VTEPLSTSLFVGAAARHLKAGEALFVAGEPGDGCYRLEQGLLKVVVTSPQGEERILAMFAPGAIVGELAVLDGRSRSASVFAVRDCELSFISRATFEERTIRILKSTINSSRYWLDACERPTTRWPPPVF
jgi:CRP/FNR family transcriptional regulator, cyclic AMP receptor protein